MPEQFTGSAVPPQGAGADRQALLVNGEAKDHSTGRDADGWIIPPPLRQFPQRQPEAEAANQRRLVSVLQAGGWHVNEQATCYDRDGNRFIPDILIWHPDMRSVGAVEVKATIQTDRQAADALKQCYDYTKCKVLATGHRVEWGAVYPLDPEPHGPPMAAAIWGALNFTALHLKVCAFIDETAYCRWRSMTEQQAVRAYNPGRLRLQYKQQHRVWCSENGFVANAKEMLTGKRKVGGSRANG